MIKLSKNHFLEILVAIFLIGILLTLFIPKFMDAQVTAKITQAKIDTARVMNAVELLQQDFDYLLFYHVNLYNDVWGDTKEKVYFRFRMTTTGNNTFEYSLIRQSFIDFIGDFPVQQLPVDLSQDGIVAAYHMSKEGVTIFDDQVFHSGFVYEKSPYDYQAPGLMNVNLHDKFPSVTITHNKPDFVHTPGPVLLPVRPRNVVYNPTNGMMSHGFIIHHN